MHPPSRDPRTPRLPLALALALTSCAGFGTLEDTGSDWSGSTWSGTHRFLLAESAQIVHCDITWTTTGSPADSNCASCEFVFDVAFVLDEEASSSDGTCDFRLQDESRELAYVSSSAQGESIGTVNSDGSFSRLGPASLLEGSFSYSFDLEFDSYGGYYEIIEEAGSAELGGDKAVDPDDTGSPASP